MVDHKGQLILLRLEASSKQRITTSKPPVKLEARLCSQEKASQTSLRFCHRDGALYFFAVDSKGHVVRKKIRNASAAPPSPPQGAPAELMPINPTPVPQQMDGTAMGSSELNSASGSCCSQSYPPQNTAAAKLTPCSSQHQSLMHLD